MTTLNIHCTRIIGLKLYSSVAIRVIFTIASTLINRVTPHEMKTIYPSQFWILVIT